MRRLARNTLVAVIVGVLPMLLVPVVVAAAELGYQCSTSGFVRLWTPRSVEVAANAPSGDHVVILEVLNANASSNDGFAKVGGTLVPVPLGLCERTSGAIGPFSGPGRIEVLVEPVGDISVWVRLSFEPAQPPTTTTTEPPTTTTTEPPGTTTTTEPPVTTTIPPSVTTTTDPGLPPDEDPSDDPPPTTTTQPPEATTTTTLPDPPLIPQGDAACVPGGFTVGDEFYSFDDAPPELFAQFPNCRSAFDEESG